MLGYTISAVFAYPIHVKIKVDENNTMMLKLMLNWREYHRELRYRLLRIIASYFRGGRFCEETQSDFVCKRKSTAHHQSNA
jgi:hypothetical protein